MRRLPYLVLLLFLGVALAAHPAWSAEKTTKPDIEYKITGQLFNDWMWGGASSRLDETYGKIQAQNYFRSARIAVEGKLYKQIEFKWEFDFAGGTTRLRDGYFSIVDVPYLGAIRIGHFKERFYFEELISDKSTPFIERALPRVFSPSRNSGVGVGNTLSGERMTWAAGFFRDSDDFGNATTDGGAWAFTGRFTGLPWYEDQGRKLLHLGAAYSYRNPVLDQVKYEYWPEAYGAPKYLSTGTIKDVENINLLGLEATFKSGPFSAQAEYVSDAVDLKGAGSPTFYGYYVMASYFLTGEERPYSTSKAVFDRPLPKKNLGRDKGGIGAFEALARYSVVDLNDEQVKGGKLRDFTLGLTWYLNPYCRIMVNYIRADQVDIGTANIFITRFQVDM
jgi:phosphate-selective porin OprO/OprP